MRRVKVLERNALGVPEGALGRCVEGGGQAVAAHKISADRDDSIAEIGYIGDA